MSRTLDSQSYMEKTEGTAFSVDNVGLTFLLTFSTKGSKAVNISLDVSSKYLDIVYSEFSVDLFLPGEKDFLGSQWAIDASRVLSAEVPNFSLTMYQSFGDEDTWSFSVASRIKGGPCLSGVVPSALSKRISSALGTAQKRTASDGFLPVDGWQHDFAEGDRAAISLSFFSVAISQEKFGNLSHIEIVKSAGSTREKIAVFPFLKKQGSKYELCGWKKEPDGFSFATKTEFIWVTKGQDSSWGCLVEVPKKNQTFRFDFTPQISFILGTIRE